MGPVDTLHCFVLQHPEKYTVTVAFAKILASSEHFYSGPEMLSVWPEPVRKSSTCFLEV